MFEFVTLDSGLGLIRVRVAVNFHGMIVYSSCWLLGDLLQT